MKDKTVSQFQETLGEMVMKYSVAEHTVALGLDLLSKSNKGTTIYKSKAGAEQKIKEFRKGFRACKEPIKAEFVELLNELDKCREIRNDFVHSIWRYLPSEVKMVKDSRDRKSGNRKISFVGMGEAAKALDRVNKIYEEITLKTVDIMEPERIKAILSKGKKPAPR